MNNYQKIKQYIFQQLQHLQDEKIILDKQDIAQEIQNINILLSSPAHIKLALFKDSNICLTHEELSRLHRELETLFDIKMDEGILIQGVEQQDRDTTWWTSNLKQNLENYYWNRYKKLLLQTLPNEVIKTVDVDTDIIMNNIENPSISNFHRYGMVVGHVQSGKTANYASLVCKAADAGYRFIVIIAGGINNLRAQTQTRINESFIGKDNKGNQIGVGRGDSNPEKLPCSLTTVERDFNKQDADRNSQGKNFDNTSSPIVVVIKKNSRTLTNIIDWLNSQYTNRINHSVLVVDDESDYASINTKEENDPTSINKKIRELLGLFNKSCYVAYTATPYANIFIDHEAGHEDFGRDLFPKDFIYALDAPSNYFGARKIFIDNPDKYLVTISDYLNYFPLKHNKELVVSELPESLLEAIRVFILNVALRFLRGQGDQHNSMMVHVTRFTQVHQNIALCIERYLEQIKSEIQAYGKIKNAVEQSKLIMDFKITFDQSINNIIDKPTWNIVLSTLCDHVNSIVVREVHQSTSIPLEYRKNRITNVIVVGGSSIARGFTLEGLSVSYFLRSTIFYDTLMQMGRWFGYRDGYEDICRIYVTDDMIDNFTRIIISTEDLINNFRLMSEAHKTPNDFGLAVQQHPDSILQITARNKQKNVYDFVFNMKLDGQLKETNRISNNKLDKIHNLQVLEEIIQEIDQENDRKNINNSVLWENINNDIIYTFLESYKIHQNDAFGLSTRMPIAFIKEYVKSRDCNWDVVLFSGEGIADSISNIKFNREKRKASLNKEEGYIEIRQISSGNSESIALNDEQRKRLGSNRKEIRSELQRPLLMLHIFETKEDERLAGFGVSFPGNVLTTDKTINLKINTVYYKNLLEELALEAQSDD